MNPLWILTGCGFVIALIYAAAGLVATGEAKVEPVGDDASRGDWSRP